MSPPGFLPGHWFCLEDCVSLQSGNHFRFCLVNNPQNYSSAEEICESFGWNLFQVGDEASSRELEELFSESIDEARPSMIWAVDQQLKLPAQ